MFSVRGRRSRRAGKIAATTQSVDVAAIEPDSASPLRLSVLQLFMATCRLSSTASSREFGLNAHGFDYFFGFKSGFIDYYHAHATATARPTCSRTTTPVHVDGYMTDLITERSVRFIEQTRRASRSSSKSPTTRRTGRSSVPDDPSKARRQRVPRPGPSDNRPATRQDYVAMLERADAGRRRDPARRWSALGLDAKHAVIFTQRPPSRSPQSARRRRREDRVGRRHHADRQPDAPSASFPPPVFESARRGWRSAVVLTALAQVWTLPGYKRSAGRHVQGLQGLRK